MRLRCVQDNGSYDIAVGMTGHFAATEIGGTTYGANGRWRAKDKLEIELRNARMAGGKRFVFQFAGGQADPSPQTPLSPRSAAWQTPCPPPSPSPSRRGRSPPTHRMYWEVNG